MTQNRPIHWNITVPERLDDALEKAVKQGSYRTKNEYVRAAVRRMLEIQENQLLPELK